jgi:hypothetical protein
MVCTFKLGAGKPHQDPVDTEEEIFSVANISKIIRLHIVLLIISTYRIHFCVVFH